jgi:hypothetical protein
LQELPTVLKFEDSSLAGTNLPNSTVWAKKVQFDAFRTKDKAPPGFRVCFHSSFVSFLFTQD